MFKPCLKMSRKDVEIDHKQVKCLQVPCVGYSSYTLKPGMFFTFRDGDHLHLARMHHRLVKTLGPDVHLRDLIVAQVIVDGFGQNHCERWVEPKDVIETRPIENMPPEIVDLFDRLVTMWDR